MMKPSMIGPHALLKRLLLLPGAFMVFSTLPAILSPVLAQAPAPQPASGVFVRFKVSAPRTVAAGERFRVTTGGHRHTGEPWYFPAVSAETEGGTWSQWLDLSQWLWHGRGERSGGIAEWPSMKLALFRAANNEAVNNCALDVQLADKPDESGVVVTFNEKSESNTIGFLVPYPLRANAKEFETGSQMTARHFAWANDATGGRPITLKKFDIITSLWGHYDPALSRRAVTTLRQLGFNVVSGAGYPVSRQTGTRFYEAVWLHGAGDPEAMTQGFKPSRESILQELKTSEGRWKYGAMNHMTISDEVKTLDLRDVDKPKLDGWFRNYLRAQGVTEVELGKPLAQIEYPLAAMHEKTLPREADLPTRRLMYHAAKFGHWWSARLLRHATDLLKGTLPTVKTEALPSDHGFFNAWGPPHIGMSYRLLDLFELGAQRTVDHLSAEDWLGLNHMYGPAYTWTGAQSFAYLNAILRGAIEHNPAAQPMQLRSLITPSDDRYLRLKAYSSLGQGAKSLFFWTFGPTYIGTENYWSDLRSEYDGIAKLNRALARSEDVLHPAKPVRDPVAILYSVSHDIWHTDNPAAFVEKRLLWHALRHLQVQPDFLREEELAVRLKPYKVLYVTDWCLSRKASVAIDEWVRRGGVLYLSAGATTRDEFYEPYVPPFARALWPDAAAQQMKSEAHSYNERTDLPAIKPLATATVNAAIVNRAGQNFRLPVLGVRLNLRANVARPLATFDDGTPAGASLRYGRGQVIALGFLPMLAYAQGANFKPVTLEEKWPAAPRELVQMALRAADVTPAAKASVPVVETSLLSGANGSALVLANYTYQPIKALTVDVKLSQPVKHAVSTEGKPVRMQAISGGVRLTLPLEWTDIVLLQRSAR